MNANGISVVQALEDRELFGALPAFKDLRTWRNWLVFMKAVYGLPLTSEEEPLFCRHTGRSGYHPPVGGYPEAVACVGVQSGKSQVASVLADHAALTGASGTHAVLIGQDHRGAMRVLLKYSREPFETLDRFTAEVVRSTADSLEFANGVCLSAYPCRPEAVRGLRACIVCIDELAFFQSTDGRPTDTEMLRVARGRVATTGGKLIILSSTYGQSGALWDLYRKHYGNDESSTLIWQASAPEMNPTLPVNYLLRMERDDPEAYRSEVLGEFRAGVSSLFDPEALAACVDHEVRERALSHAGCWFLDAASGSGRDSLVVAKAHYDHARQVGVLDAVRIWRPPFNPSGALAEVCDLVKASGEAQLEGDRYAPGFVAEDCRAHGVTYRFSPRDRSQIYLELLPLVNAARVRVLDHPDLLRELRGLERRRGPSGRDKVDHRSGQHDDIANACAGALVLVAKAACVAPFKFSCDGQSLAMGHEEPVPVGQPSAPGVITLPQPEPSLAEQVKEIRKKAVLNRTPEEAALVTAFFEEQAQRLNALNPLERQARTGGFFPDGGAPDLAADLEEVEQTFREFRGNYGR